MSSLPPTPVDNARTVTRGALDLGLELCVLAVLAAWHAALHYARTGDAEATADGLRDAAARVQGLGDQMYGHHPAGPR